jgi:hypothetical protein
MSLISLAAKVLLPLLSGEAAAQFAIWCGTLSILPTHDVANGILIVVYAARSLNEIKKIAQKVLVGQAAQEPFGGRYV